MLFSVLIPVYNAEKYLSECLDSIICQTYSDYEIIMVDDGSTDHSGEICDQYQERYSSFIKVKHTKNNGCLSARNTLIGMASGDYLVHIDADDYIRPDTLCRLKDAIQHYSADLVIYGIHRIGMDGNETDQLFQEGINVYEGDRKKEIYKAMCRSDILNNYVTKVASRALVQKCNTYQEYSYVRSGEDLLASLPLVTNARKIVYLGEPLYCYHKNPNSRTATVGIKRYESEKTVYRELIRYSELWGIAETTYYDILKRYATMCIDTLIIATRYSKDINALFNMISSDPIFLESQNVLNAFPIWKRVLGWAAIKNDKKLFNMIQTTILCVSNFKRFKFRR